MNELYTKVTVGRYPDIPKHFSKELSKVIGLCLNVNPLMRPSAEELAAMPELGLVDPIEAANERDLARKARSKIHKRSASENQQKVNLLGTIKLPRNLKQLNQGLLPKSNYDEIEKDDPGTFSSERPPKNHKKMEYEEASKVGYESEATALQKKKEQYQADVRAARAARYRESSV